MRMTRQCHRCHNNFNKSEMIQYAREGAVTMHWYCPDCLEEKKSQEHFENKVCTIFGIKSPGPRIWTDRKRLRETYGYTDNTIVDCLEYLYNVEHKQKLSESLCLINPSSVDRAIQWKRAQEKVADNLVAAMEYTPKKKIVVPIKEEAKTQ